jgi:uncharacterized protein YabE (DUF348 family)
VDKSVNLVVDGQARTVHTTAARVSDVLKTTGYSVGAHDVIAPSLTSSVHDHSRVVLNRGRLLHLDVNGVRKDVWTTAPTVEAAMQQLGYSTANFTSVSRSQRLPLTPTDIAIRSPKWVTLVHDGHTETISTTEPTVGALLTDLGVKLGGTDKVSPGSKTELASVARVVVQRIHSSRVTAAKALPFPTSRVSSSSLPSGTTQVAQAGRNGKAELLYSVVYVDGKIAGKTLVKTTVVQHPVPQIIRVGTAQTQSGGSGASVASAPAVAVSPGSAQAIAQSMAAARGWGSDQFSCLVTMWNHESGWRVNAANPSGAYGIPQALPGSKMGPGWQTDARVQISWGLGYIASRYGTPCGAWALWQQQGWY